jgi:uncharacterized protein YdeI (YjbR/CyaY-like superfamily)
MKMKYFKSATDFRRWLEKNHATTHEFWVDYHKKSSGQPSMTWPESVDATAKAIEESANRKRLF